MRLFCAAAISLTIGLFLAIADDKKPIGEEGRAEQFTAIKKRYDQELTDLKKRFMKTSDAATRMGIREEVRELVILTSRDVLKLIESNPKDDTGFNAAAFVLETTRDFGGGDECNQAIAVVTEHHLGNPKLKKLLPSLCSAGKAGEKFFQTLAEKSSDKEMRGLAFFYQGFMIGRDLEGDEEDGKTIDLMITKATNLFEKAEKEAPEALIGNSKMSMAVAAELQKLKNLTLVAVGKPAPDVEGTDLKGKSVKLSSFKGKVVLLDFWGTFCPPCRAMIPHEREMVKNLQGKPFVLLSVSCDEEKDTLMRFLERESMPWEHWFDGQEGVVSRTFRVGPVPTLYAIDHMGVIRGKWIGSQSSAKMERTIEDLVEEAVKAK